MKSVNRYQRDVVRFFMDKGLLVEDEYPVGPYSIDIFLPELGVGVEIDGPMHISKKRDRQRDEEILRMDDRIKAILRFPVGYPKEKILEEVLLWYKLERG